MILLSDRLVALYLPSATVIVNFLDSDILTISLSSITAAPVVTSYSSFLAASQGTSSNSTAHLNSNSKLAIIYQNNGFVKTSKSGADYFQYTRTDHAYLILWESASGNTNLRVLKVGPSSVTYVNEFLIGTACETVFGKNNRFVCGFAAGYQVYAFTDAGAVSMVHQNSYSLAAPVLGCLVQDTEILLKSSSQDYAVVMSTSTSSEIFRINSITGTVNIRPTAEGCSLQGVLNGTKPSLLTITSSEYTFMKKRYYGRNYEDVNSHTPFIIDGVIFSVNNTGSLDLLFIDQEEFFKSQRQNTSELELSPVGYKIQITKQNPANKMLPLFPGVLNTSHFLAMDFSASTAYFTPVITTNFTLKCSSVSYSSVLLSNDYYFKNMLAKNPNFGRENELLVIVKNPDFKDSYGEETYKIALIILILSCTITVVILTVGSILAYRSSNKKVQKVQQQSRLPQLTKNKSKEVNSAWNM